MAKTPLRAALALVAGILITIGGCSDNQPAAPARVASAEQFQKVALRRGPSYDLLGAAEVRSDKVIGPEGGTLDIGGGHSITFPAGALSAPIRIRGRADVRYIQVDLGPNGLRFPEGREPILTMSYANAAAPVADDRLTIIYIDESGRTAEDLNGQVDPVQKTVSAKLQHFSLYAMVSH